MTINLTQSSARKAMAMGMMMRMMDNHCAKLVV